MKETRIIISELYYKKYLQLIEYIGKCESVRFHKMGEGDGTEVHPVQIESINGSGNPPIYKVELIAHTDIEFEEGKRQLSEAVKGLVDILSSE